MDTVSKIRNLIDTFTTDIAAIVQSAVDEEVTRRLRAPAKAAPPAKKRAPTKKTTNGRRRTPQAGYVLAVIKNHPGQRVEQLADIMRVDSKSLRPVVAKLLADGKLRRRGKARGTTYTAK